MDLKSYVRTLRHNLVLIIAAGVVGLLGGLGVGLLSPDSHTSRTQLFVSISGSGSVSDLQQGSTFTQERLQTYVEMAEGRAVLQPVIDELDLDETPEQLARRIDASTDPDTVLITIEVTDESAERAAETAEAVASGLVSVVTQLEDPEGQGASPVRLSVAEDPVPALVPSGPSLWFDTVLGLLAGTVLGVGCALLLSAFDTKLRGRDDLHRISRVPVLASIPADPAASRTPLVTDIPMYSPRSEAFRRLRTNLRFAQVGDSLNSVLVSSAVAGEGKTATSINLAIVMAHAGQRVALIDADLRRPQIADRMGLENAAGLTTALLGTAEVTDLLQPWGEDELYVLTAGEVPPNPAELLESQAMERLLGQLTGEFDLVIIDGPPLLPVADGLSLAQRVGRVVLVAGVGQVRTGEVQEAVSSLAMVSATRVGIVLNRVPATGFESSGYAAAYSPLPDSQTPTSGIPASGFGQGGSGRFVAQSGTDDGEESGPGSDAGSAGRKDPDHEGRREDPKSDSAARSGAGAAKDAPAAIAAGGRAGR